MRETGGHCKPNLTRSGMFVLTALLFLAFSSGCSRPEPAEESSAPSTVSVAQPSEKAPEYGGRIVEASIGDATNLIWPLATDSGSHAIADEIYVGLLKYDKNIELVPYAAQSYEVLDEGRKLTFKLREDIRWTDGQPLTAEDVQFTYELMVDPETPTAYAGDFLMVDEFRLTGKYSFEVTYEKPYSRALVTWAHGILPKHVLEDEDLLDTPYSRDPVGAGPYRLKEWISGRRVVLEANEDFFLGRPYIDERIYRVVPDIATQFLELKAGNLDLMTLTPQQYLYQTGSDWWKRNFRKYKYLSFGYSYLGYNMRSPFFSDKRVRRAFAHAVDKEEIVKGVLFGLGVPAVGPYKPGTWVYNEEITPYNYDPARALELLAEVGWTDSDGDGLLDRDGRPFAFTILTNQGNSQRVKTATIIQQRLAEIGIQVEIRTVEWAAFLKEFVDKGRFDAVLLSWNILQDPDISGVWHSSKAVPGGLNFIYYKNQELDRLLEEGKTTLDQSERKVIYDRVQEILHEDQPYLFLYVPYSLPVAAARIRGIEPAPAGIGHNTDWWWIPANLQQ